MRTLTLSIAAMLALAAMADAGPFRRVVGRVFYGRPVAAPMYQPVYMPQPSYVPAHAYMRPVGLDIGGLVFRQQQAAQSCAGCTCPGGVCPCSPR